MATACGHGEGPLRELTAAAGGGGAVALACGACGALTTPCLACGSPLTVWPEPHVDLDARDQDPLACGRCGLANPGGGAIGTAQRGALGLPPPTTLPPDLVRRVQSGHGGRRRYLLAQEREYTALRAALQTLRKLHSGGGGEASPLSSQSPAKRPASPASQLAAKRRDGGGDAQQALAVAAAGSITAPEPVLQPCVEATAGQPLPPWEKVLAGCEAALVRARAARIALRCTAIWRADSAAAAAPWHAPPACVCRLAGGGGDSSGCAGLPIFGDLQLALLEAVHATAVPMGGPDEENHAAGYSGILQRARAFLAARPVLLKLQAAAAAARVASDIGRRDTAALRSQHTNAMTPTALPALLAERGVAADRDAANCSDGDLLGDVNAALARLRRRAAMSCSSSGLDGGQAIHAVRAAAAVAFPLLLQLYHDIAAARTSAARLPQSALQTNLLRSDLPVHSHCPPLTASCR
eukprot:SM000192S04917  [mRNA]  locus=s192:243237:245934:- [translate_table: standard]